MRPRIPTRSLWIAEGITDYYAPLTVRRAGLSDTKEYLGTDTPPSPGSLSDGDRRTAIHAGTPGAIGRAVVVRRVDQALPAGRELGQHHDQLLHEGRGRGMAARRAHPARDRREEIARRSDAAGFRAIFRRRGFTPGYNSKPRPRRSRARRSAISSGARWNRPKSWIIRKRSTGSA